VPTFESTSASSRPPTTTIFPSFSTIPQFSLPTFSSGKRHHLFEAASLEKNRTWLNLDFIKCSWLAFNMMVQYFLFALLLTYSFFFKPASLKRDYSSLYLSLTWKFVVFTKHEPSLVSLRFQFRPETQAKNANEVLTGDQNAAFNAGITTRSIKIHHNNKQCVTNKTNNTQHYDKLHFAKCCFFISISWVLQRPSAKVLDSVWASK